MKNSTTIFGLAILLTLSLNAFQFALEKNRPKEISFTIKNDLEQSITLYIGKGTTILDAGAAYKFSKEVGEKIYLGEKGAKGKLLITIKASDEGKIFKLSNLIEK